MLCRPGRLLPEGDADFPGCWRAIKIAFSKSVPPGEPRSSIMASRGERGVWQRRYWEHTIRDDQDFAVHLDYIRFNPVQHGLVEHPADWPDFLISSVCGRRALSGRMDGRW